MFICHISETYKQAVDPTQTSIQGEPVVIYLGEKRPGVKLMTHIRQVASLRMSGPTVVVGIRSGYIMCEFCLLCICCCNSLYRVSVLT